MKTYVYLTKEDDGVLVSHYMMAENRLKVKEKTGTCIDNIYSLELINNVESWLLVNGCSLICEDGHVVFVTKNNRLRYVVSFVEFRNIVSEYRKR